MNTTNVIAAISAAVAALSLAVAVLQYLSARRRERTDRERLAQHQERLRMAVSATEAASRTADLMVQRAKGGATPDELMSVARVLRGNLQLLGQRLQHETDDIPEKLGGGSFLSFRQRRARRSPS